MILTYELYMGGDIVQPIADPKRCPPPSWTKKDSNSAIFKVPGCGCSWLESKVWKIMRPEMSLSEMRRWQDGRAWSLSHGNYLTHQWVWSYFYGNELIMVKSFPAPGWFMKWFQMLIITSWITDKHESQISSTCDGASPDEHSRHDLGYPPLSEQVCRLENPPFMCQSLLPQ